MQILTGNCLDVLPTLADTSIQSCITSPAYYNLRNYQVAGQLGLEATPAEYVANLVAVFREVRRVLRDDGTVWINIGDSYSAGGRGPPTEKPWKQNTNPGSQLDAKRTPGFAAKQLLMIPTRVAIALQDDGWILRSDIIWHKPAPMPESVKDRPTSAHEHVFLLAKSSRYYYDADAIREPPTGRTDPITGFGDVADRRDGGRAYHQDGLKGANARNVWKINTKPFKGAHFATMPTELAEKCIKAGTSEHGCCSRCGAPWQRMQKRTGADGRSSLVAAQSRYAKDECGNHLSANAQYEKLPTNGGTRATFRREFVLKNHDLGWAASCSCEADVVPCTVLDPFAGAGTTAFAATSLGRDSVSIELNPDYVAMAQARVWPLAAILLGSNSST